MLLRRLVGAFFAEASCAGLWPAALHFAGSLRALRHPRKARLLVNVLDRHRPHFELEKWDFFHHIRHRHYLSNRFSALERIDAVLYHYQHELRYALPTYRQQVYGGSGLALWQASVSGCEFCIRLVASTDKRWEGDLSVILYVNGVQLSVMSFSWVDAAMFGLPSAPIIFVTRNQSARAEPEQTLFRAAFKPTAPQYFCLAAVTGIARANSMSGVAAVRHDAQIAHSPHNDATLVNSYNEFWRAFQATELDRHAFLLPVPMALVPVGMLRAKHRKRALDRREAWSEVAASAAAAVAQFQIERRAPGPAARGKGFAPSAARPERRCSGPSVGVSAALTGGGAARTTETADHR